MRSFGNQNISHIAYTSALAPWYMLHVEIPYISSYSIPWSRNQICCSVGNRGSVLGISRSKKKNYKLQKLISALDAK